MDTTREIPRAEWERFLTDFSHSHRDELVRLEISGQELGDQTLGARLALLGVGLEKKGSAKGDIDIALTLKSPGGVMDHRIEAPSRLYLREGTEDGSTCLDIEDDEHEKTLVFVAPARA